jgi:thioredoxin reductase (NADPH)
MQPYDCAVIGGGPAGLLAAVYLARFRRRTLLVHDGQSRARWIPRTRNVPGYPHGIEGKELLERLEEQAGRYDIDRVATRVVSVEGASGSFVLNGDGGPWHARRVILATGVHDVVPGELRMLWPLVSQGLVRLCPVCDAFELCDKRIGLLARGARAEREAKMLSVFGDVTVLTHGGEDISRSFRFIRGRISSVKEAAQGVAVMLEDGESLDFDALYVGFGVEVYSGLAAKLGARCDDAGYLFVDQKQQTSVPGLYAAGDVVQSLSQISVAFGQAAIAASAINVALNEERQALT